MLKRVLWLAVPLVILVAALSLVALPSRTRWTTSSPAAREAFEAAMGAQSRLYESDARRHLERAVELDPDFVAAKLELALSLRSIAPERAHSLLASVLAADMHGLQPVERLEVERARAFASNQQELADRLLDEYLGRFPNDARALQAKASNLMNRGEREKAARLYRRLTELSPNWVLSYNQLGYIALAEGRFGEAEEYFTSYRFIAPEQANPHDSLGELYVIVGRYEEAEHCFETALAIRDDFWESYAHLVLMRAVIGDDLGAVMVADKVEAEGWLDPDAVAALRCTAQMWRLMREQSWHGVLHPLEKDAACLENPLAGGIGFLAIHRAACREGRMDLALKVEQQYAERLRDVFADNDSLQPAEIAHMRGLRLALSGELDEALREAATADRQLDYGDAATGLFKLCNRLLLIEILRAQGRDADAKVLISKVASVNPRLALDFEKREITISGLT